MTITGRYTQSNKAPMVFQLGSEDCATYVSEKPGAPSKPVVRLANGDVGLGDPVKVPVPGISLNPDGVVVPVSVPPSPSQSPIKGPPPVESASPSPSTVPSTNCDLTPRPALCPTPDDPINSPSPSPSPEESEETPPIEVPIPADEFDPPVEDPTP
jgi:serine/threonine-protein kinase